MGEEVEGHEGDQQPVGLGPRQLGLGQVHRVEDGDDGQDLGNVPCNQHSQEHEEEYLIELQTEVREDFTGTEKAPTTAFSWLKVTTSAFTFSVIVNSLSTFV